MLLRSSALIADALSKADRMRLRVQGTSMLPTLPDGSIVEVERSDPRLLRPGDIVLALAHNRTDGEKRQSLFIHRIIKRFISYDGVILVTRGDNCPFADRPISVDKILGKVVGVIDSQGNLVEFNEAWTSRYQVWKGRAQSLFCSFLDLKKKLLQVRAPQCPQNRFKLRLF